MMRISGAWVSVVTFALSASAQNGASKYFDPITGITFSSVTHANGVSYRVALPINATMPDTIVQIASPSSFAWCGLAWGGHMTNNPLSVAWSTGATDGERALVSSRMAFGYYAIPQPYEGATYTPLHTSATAEGWSITARCQGCTQWSSSDGDFNLQNDESAVLAYACSSVAPDTPSSNSSTFNIHEQFGIWSHDLTLARNASYAKWVKSSAEQLGKRWVG
ncbi:CBD9-like protein [Ophiobolus disseminans]|uniref:CBD9-like protein n=1 Tax=Ophiobolus disseminans TaxID=1469910 RepID=A0A6A6ZK03_9PLEO|nr:CBD9-like protein [Ophiobolus disseminans]